MKATELMARTDLRRSRAMSLVAAVMQRIDPYLDDQIDRGRRDVYEALMELFYNEGVDVITDATRAEAGLPPRGPDGYTLDEIVALEKRRLEFLMAPIVVKMRA